MSDDDEIQQVVEIERAADGKRSPFDMDKAFCTRMREVITAGLENAPIGVVATPGTRYPKYVPAEPLPLPSPQRAMEHA
jgi:hypothetical protein